MFKHCKIKYKIPKLATLWRHNEERDVLPGTTFVLFYKDRPGIQYKYTVEQQT